MPLEPSKVTVQVSVNDGSSPVGYANVTLSDADNEYSGRTGSAGGCNIQNVPEGTYTVTATKTGYVDYSTEDVEISEENKTLSITMTEESKRGE